MNLIKTTRTSLDMTQAQFGEWLGEQLGKPAYSFQSIANWESGKRSPRRNVREVCEPVAAAYITSKIINSKVKFTGSEMSEMIIKGMK